MAKYQKKTPVTIEAEVYREGLEDGFEFYDEQGNFICYMTKEECKTRRVPYVVNKGGVRVKISEKDYIITEDDGYRYPCDSNVFEKIYKKAE